MSRAPLDLAVLGFSAFLIYSVFRIFFKTLFHISNKNIYLCCKLPSFIPALEQAPLKVIRNLELAICSRHLSAMKQFFAAPLACGTFAYRERPTGVFRVQ